MMTTKRDAPGHITQVFEDFRNGKIGTGTEFNVINDFCAEVFRKNIDVQKISNWADKEDVFQDVMSYIVVHKMDFSAERITDGRKTSFTAWVNCISSSKAIDFLRRNTIKTADGKRVEKRNIDIDECTDKICSDYGNVEALMIHEEQIQYIEKAVTKLNDRYESTIRMYYFENYSEKEIAEKLGTTVSAVEKIMLRARRRMKEYFQQNGYQPFVA